MSERGIIVTDPIYDDATRELVERVFSKAGPTTRVGKGRLSLVCEASGLYAGEERVIARGLAEEIAQGLRPIETAVPTPPIRIIAIPDTASAVLLEVFHDDRVVETPIVGEWDWK